MILISSRKDFWSATEIADTDEIRDCDLLDPNPAVDKPITVAKMRQAVRNKRVLLLVHGYNNDEDDVARSYAKIESKCGALLAGCYDVVMGYTWPGGNLRISYPLAKARAKSCFPRLKAWLSQVSAAAGSLDLMCHSLGNYVALRALTDSADDGTPVRNAWMLAAAVDNESIEKGEKYFTGTQRCARMCVLHSNRDSVLKFAFPVGETISFGLPDVALGLSGPEDPADIMNHSQHVKVANCKRVVGGHGEYKECDPVYNYIRGELQGAGAPQFATL